MALRRGLRWRRSLLALKFSKIAVAVAVYKSLLGLVEGRLVYTVQLAAHVKVRVIRVYCV